MRYDEQWGPYDEQWGPSLSVAHPSRDPRASTEDLGDEFTRPLGELLKPIKRWFWVVAMTALACTGLIVGYSMMQAPTYQASIKVVIGQEGKMFADPGQAVYLQQLAPTLSEAIATRPVMEAVVKDLNLQISPETLIYSTTAEPLADSQFIDVSYTDTDAKRAQMVVNAIGEEFENQIAGESVNDAVTVSVWNRALGAAQVSPNTMLNGSIAAVIGVVLGIGLAFLLDYRDKSWRSSEEAEQISGAPTLGAIPAFKALNAKKW